MPFKTGQTPGNPPRGHCLIHSFTASSICSVTVSALLHLPYITHLNHQNLSSSERSDVAGLPDPRGQSRQYIRIMLFTVSNDGAQQQYNTHESFSHQYNIKYYVWENLDLLMILNKVRILKIFFFIFSSFIIPSCSFSSSSTCPYSEHKPLPHPVNALFLSELCWKVCAGLCQGPGGSSRKPELSPANALSPDTHRGIDHRRAALLGKQAVYTVLYRM